MARAGSVLPPILAAYLPPVLSERRRALEQGAWLPASSRPSEAAPLRGALALLLRSVACADPERNYCSLATAPEPTAAALWRCQCWRLLLCCAALLGGPPGPPTDILLQAAAARTVAVLLDELQWKCHPAGAAAHGRIAVEPKGAQTWQATASRCRRGVGMAAGHTGRARVCRTACKCCARRACLCAMFYASPFVIQATHLSARLRRRSTRGCGGAPSSQQQPAA